MADLQTRSSITAPSLTQPGHINPIMMMQTGTLCHANGTIPGKAGYKLTQAYVAVVPYINGSTLPPTPSTSQMAIIDNPGAVAGDDFVWSTDQNMRPNTVDMLGTNANCVNGPYLNTMPYNNVIFVIGHYEKGVEQIDGDPDNTKFVGIKDATCSSWMIAKAVGDDMRGMQLSALGSAGHPATLAYGYRACMQHKPDCCSQREWFTFDALDVANFRGNQLFLQDGELRASTIAVAARSVNWRPKKESRLVIRRPSGLVMDYNSSGNGLLGFAGMPPYSIVIWQAVPGLAHVVLSECIDHPDVVSLDPNYPVFVSVNDGIASYHDHIGAFSLSVAILD